MTITAVTPDWTSTRYFALKGERRNPTTGEWLGDLVNHPATAFYAKGANLPVLDTDRQVVIWANPLPASHVCTCEGRNALVSLMVMWEGRGQRFETTAHLDGTTCAAAGSYGSRPRPYCPTCGNHDTLTTRQYAWHDLTTCTTEGCDFERSYSIGD